jgi:hypothetical protein
MQPKPSRAYIRFCATAFFDVPARILNPAENYMPFINGKFYMNPAYGRAIERARKAGGIWSEERPEFAGAPLQKQNFSNEGSPSNAQQQSSGDHWVTINGRHVLIQGTSAEQARMTQPVSEKERYLSIVVFNETGGLSPSAKNGNGSAQNLRKSGRNAY